ncbi:hypothetical protein KJR58_24260 [Escherichia coli]|nr:hypothetical protein [Escherichia coli]
MRFLKVTGLMFAILEAKFAPAKLCGFAGANFASSMANISFFFPKQKQGGALGLNWLL